MDGETRHLRWRNTVPLRRNSTPVHQQYIKREKQNPGNIWTQVSLSVRKLIRKNKKSNMDKKSKGPPTIPLYYYYPQKHSDYLSQLENMCQMYHKKVQNLNKLRNSFANDLMARNKLLMKQNKKLMQLNKEQDEKEELFNRGLRLVFESYQNEKKISELNEKQIKTKLNSKTNSQTFFKNKYQKKRSIFTLTSEKNGYKNTINDQTNKSSFTNEQNHNLASSSAQKSIKLISKNEYLSKISLKSKDQLQSTHKKVYEEQNVLPKLVNMKNYSSPNIVKLGKSRSVLDKKLNALETCYSSSISSYRSHTRLNTSDSLDIRPVKLENKKKQTKSRVAPREKLSEETSCYNSIDNIKKEENFRKKLKRLPLIISSNIYNSEISQKILKDEKPFFQESKQKGIKLPVVQNWQKDDKSFSSSHNLNHLPPIKSSMRCLNLKKCQEWNDSQSPKILLEQSTSKFQNTQNSKLLTKVNVIKQLTHQKLKNKDEKDVFNPVVKWPHNDNQTILLPRLRKSPALPKLDTTELHSMKNHKINSIHGQKVVAFMLENTLNSLSEMADIVRQNIEDELSSRIKNIQVESSKQSFQKTNTQTQTDVELLTPCNQETLFDFKTTRKIISSFFRNKFRERIKSELDSMSEQNDLLIRTTKNAKQVKIKKNVGISSISDSMLVKYKNMDFQRNKLPPLYPKKNLNATAKIENWLKNISISQIESPVVDDIVEEISLPVPSIEQCDVKSNTIESGSYRVITNFPQHDNMDNIIEKVSLTEINISCKHSVPSEKKSSIQPNNCSICYKNNSGPFLEISTPPEHENWLESKVNVDIEETSLPEIAIPVCKSNCCNCCSEHESRLNKSEYRDCSMINVDNIKETSLSEIAIPVGEHSSNLREKEKSNCSNCCTECRSCQQEIINAPEHENWLKMSENQDCSMIIADNIEETSLSGIAVPVGEHSSNLRENEESNYSNCYTESGSCQKEIINASEHKIWLKIIENQDRSMINADNIEETSLSGIAVGEHSSDCTNCCTKSGSCQQEIINKSETRDCTNVDNIKETSPEIPIRKHASNLSENEESNCCTESGSYQQEIINTSKHWLKISEKQDCSQQSIQQDWSNYYTEDIESCQQETPTNQNWLKITTRDHQTEQKCAKVGDNIEETSFPSINLSLNEEKVLNTANSLIQNLKFGEADILLKVSQDRSEIEKEKTIQQVDRINDEILKYTSREKQSEQFNKDPSELQISYDEGEKEVDSECCTSESNLKVTIKDELNIILEHDNVIEQGYSMIEDVIDSREISSKVSTSTAEDEKGDNFECLPESGSYQTFKPSKTAGVVEKKFLSDQANLLDEGDNKEILLENDKGGQKIIDQEETVSFSENEISVQVLSPKSKDSHENESYQLEQAIFEEEINEIPGFNFQNSKEQNRDETLEVECDQIDTKKEHKRKILWLNQHQTQKEDVDVYKSEISIQENFFADDLRNKKVQDIFSNWTLNSDLITIPEETIKMSISEHHKINDESIKISNESIQEDLDTKYILYEILNFIEQRNIGENLHEICLPQSIDNIKSNIEEIKEHKEAQSNIFDDIIHELYLDPNSCINYFSGSFSEMALSKQKELIEDKFGFCEDIEQECGQSELITDEFEHKGTIQSKVQCTSEDEEHVQSQSNETVRHPKMDVIKHQKIEEPFFDLSIIAPLKNQENKLKPDEGIEPEIKSENESIQNQPPCLEDNTDQENCQVCLKNEQEVHVGSINSSCHEDNPNIYQIFQEIAQINEYEIISKEQNLIEDSQSHEVISESILIKDVNNDIVNMIPHIDQEYTKQQDGGQITCEIELLTGQFRCDSDDEIDQDSGKHVRFMDIELTQDTNRKVDQIICEIQSKPSVCQDDKRDKIQSCQDIEFKETCKNEQDIKIEKIYNSDEWETDESSETESIDLKSDLNEDKIYNDQSDKEDVRQDIQDIKNDKKGYFKTLLNQDNCEKNESIHGDTTDEWTTDEEEDHDADDVICQQDLSKTFKSQKDVSSIFSVDKKETERGIYEEFLELKKRKLDCYNEPFGEKNEEIIQNPTYFNNKIFNSVKFQSEPIRPKSKSNQRKYVHLDTNTFPVKVQNNERKTNQQLDMDPKENIIHKVLKYEINTSSRMANYSINANISPINKDIK